MPREDYDLRSMIASAMAGSAPEAAGDPPAVAFPPDPVLNIVGGRADGFPYGDQWNFGIKEFADGIMKIASGMLFAGGTCITVEGKDVDCSNADAVGKVIYVKITAGAGWYLGVIQSDLKSLADLVDVTPDTCAYVPLFKVYKVGDEESGFTYGMDKDYIHGMTSPQLYSLKTS